MMHEIWVNEAEMRCSCGIKFVKSRRGLNMYTPEEHADLHQLSNKPSVIRYGSYPEMTRVIDLPLNDSILTVSGFIEGRVEMLDNTSYFGKIYSVIKDANGRPLSVLVRQGSIQIEIPWAQIKIIETRKDPA